MQDFRTEEMVNKNIFKLKSQTTNIWSFVLIFQKLLSIADEDRNIVTLAGCPSQYIDENFFIDQMNEKDPNDQSSAFKTIPVNIRGLRVDWVFKASG